MAEIVGLAASIVQLGGAGVKLSIELHNFITSTARADKDVIDLAEDLDTTGSALDHVGSTLRARHMRALASPQAINVAAKIVRRCEIIFAEVQEIINKRRKFDKHGKEVLTLAGKLSWPLKEQKVELLRRRLDSLKLSLSLLLDVLKLAQGERQSDLASEMQQKRETIRDLHRQRETAIQREIGLEAKIKNLELEQVAPSKADQVTSIYAANTLDPNIASQVQQPLVFDVKMTAIKNLSTYEWSSSDSDTATTEDEDDHLRPEELDRCAQQVQRLLHCIEHVQNEMSEGRALKRHRKRRMYKSYQRFCRRFEQNFERNCKATYSKTTSIHSPQRSLAPHHEERDSFCIPILSGAASEPERIGPTVNEAVTHRGPNAAQTNHSSHNWCEMRLGDTSAAGVSALRPARRLRKPSGACFPGPRKSASQPVPSSSSDVNIPTPTPYGTRTRKRPGRPRFDSTEDTDINFETDDPASVKDDVSEHNHELAHDDNMDGRSTPGSHKFGSRDITPATHFSLNGVVKMSEREKRKLQQQEKLFEQMEDEQHKGKRGKRNSAGSTLNTPRIAFSKRLGHPEPSPSARHREHSQDKKPDPLLPTLREPQSNNQSGTPWSMASRSMISEARRSMKPISLASTKHSVQASPIASPNTVPAVPAESRPVGAVTLSSSTAPIHPAPPSVPFIDESDPYGFGPQGFQEDFRRDSSTTNGTYLDTEFDFNKAMFATDATQQAVGLSPRMLIDTDEGFGGQIESMDMQAFSRPTEDFTLFNDASTQANFFPDFNQFGPQQYTDIFFDPSERDAASNQMRVIESDQKSEEGLAGHNKRKIEVGCASESKKRKILENRPSLVSSGDSVSKEWISLLEDPLSSTTQASTRDIVDMLLEQWTVPISV